MKRNTALFGASVVAGIAAASGLVATSMPSSAATAYYGAAYNDPTSGSARGWASGAYSTPDFSGTASPGAGTFKTVLGSSVSVSAKCDGSALVTTVSGGGAAGTYKPGSSVSLAKFIGASGANGSVTFGSVKVGGHTAGAYITMGIAPGTYVALAGADCDAATPPPTSSTTTPPPSSSTTTPPPTSSTTTPPPSSSTTVPPSSSTTPPPSSSTTAPPSTTEPPTPTPTTTTMPVTG